MNASLDKDQPGNVPRLMIHLLGITMPKTRPMDGTVLPGAMMPELWDTLERWIPDGQTMPQKLLLSESYRLTPESYAFRDPSECEPPHGHVCWVDIALTLRPHQLRAPPVNGFWDALHLARHGAHGVSIERLRRMIGGARGYLPKWRVERYEEELRNREIVEEMR